VSLDSEAYLNFLKCVTNLKEHCNDMDIRNGMVRQRTNDKSSIFEIDLTSIVGESTFVISDLRKKIDLLKMFSGQGDVDINITQSHFIFSDQFSSIKFISPTLQFVDNKYMTEEELHKVFIMDEDDLILDCEMSNVITERIRVTTTNFNILAIQVLFEGEAASILAATQAKDQFAKFISDIPTNVILEKCAANLPIVPFSIEHDIDVKFKMYKDPNHPITLNKLETAIGDAPINVYTRSTLINDEE
jgi:hypothetical protein